MLIEVPQRRITSEFESFFHQYFCIHNIYICMDFVYIVSSHESTVCICALGYTQHARAHVST